MNATHRSQPSSRAPAPADQSAKCRQSSVRKVHVSQASFTPVFPSSLVLLQTDNYDECFRTYIRPAIISLPLRYSACLSPKAVKKRVYFQHFVTIVNIPFAPLPSLSPAPLFFAPLLIPLSVTRHPPSLPLSPLSPPSLFHSLFARLRPYQLC